MVSPIVSVRSHGHREAPHGAAHQRRGGRRSPVGPASAHGCGWPGRSRASWSAHPGRENGWDWRTRAVRQGARGLPRCRVPGRWRERAAGLQRRRGKPAAPPAGRPCQSARRSPLSAPATPAPPLRQPVPCCIGHAALRRTPRWRRRDCPGARSRRQAIGAGTGNGRHLAGGRVLDEIRRELAGAAAAAAYLWLGRNTGFGHDGTAFLHMGWRAPGRVVAARRDRPGAL